VLFQDLEHAGFFYQATYPLSQISGCTYPFEKPLLIHQRHKFRYSKYSEAFTEELEVEVIMSAIAPKPDQDLLSFPLNNTIKQVLIPPLPTIYAKLAGDRRIFPLPLSKRQDYRSNRYGSEH
jgi:hypothetical protein